MVIISANTETLKLYVVNRSPTRPASITDRAVNIYRGQNARSMLGKRRRR